MLGQGNEGFYAEPAKSHLELWRSPENCWGWRVVGHKEVILRCSARDYLKYLITKYLKNST